MVPIARRQTIKPPDPATSTTFWAVRAGIAKGLFNFDRITYIINKTKKQGKKTEKNNICCVCINAPPQYRVSLGGLTAVCQSSARGQ